MMDMAASAFIREYINGPSCTCSVTIPSHLLVIGLCELLILAPLLSVLQVSLPRCSSTEDIPSCNRKEVVVLCCGNPLRGDDGFGPAVADYLEKNYEIPDGVCIVDMGTAITPYLIDITWDDLKPKRMIIVDSIDSNKNTDMKPGEIFEVCLEEYVSMDKPEIVLEVSSFNKDAGRFFGISHHTAPTFELLKMFRDINRIDVDVCLCQVEKTPEEVEMGLSPSVREAVPRMCEFVIKKTGDVR